MGLYPTKTRLNLLRAVAAGEVMHYRNWGHDPDQDKWRVPGERHRVVTTRMEELRRAGWVELGNRTVPSLYAPSLWSITDLGREILDAP